MESSRKEIAFELLPHFRAYKDGTMERFFGTDIVPPIPCLDPKIDVDVSSKDVKIHPETGVSARLFVPNKKIKQGHKLPLLVYFHGGAYCVGSAVCSTYHNYLTSVVAEASVVALSVDYRLAPEHPLPIAYQDSWNALKWVAEHSSGKGTEASLNNYADLQRVFLAGDSAGANIAHNMAARAGVQNLEGVNLKGVCLFHPDFANKEGHVPGAWLFACPTTTGSDDPRINPSVDPRLSSLRCSKVLVCVAGKDEMRESGTYYYDTLKKSGWGGLVEMWETPGEGHVFHLFNPTCEKGVTLLKKLASFINQD